MRLSRVCFGAAVLLVLASANALPAQHLLYVEHDGQPALVVGASEIFPRIRSKDKLITAHTSRLALAPTAEFLPFFVAIRDLRVSTSGILVRGSSAINNDLHVTGNFEAGYRLDDVFVVFDITTEHSGRQIFLWEIGNMLSHETKAVHITVPLTSPLGSGHYEIHVFAGGGEVLTSQIPVGVREGALDRMIAKRVAQKADGPPQPYVGPVPEYPPDLRKSNASGEAVISFLIDRHGGVRGPEIKSATAPAFGESALAAARLWRFLPAVKDGRPIETRAEMPFVFPPPHPAENKS
jgi:TonB family protein